ncbi:hypothetical protein NKI96_10720 [Mesorhizobium sp. M0292]|uniref:hypothetical protein n=1 Tax=Mesorhizobium sp. M0292 TaxID=2956929 RepID=UPI00333CE805
MTAIVALVDNGRAWMGGDSAANYDDAIEAWSNPKVFRAGEYLVGFTGSFRLGQLLQHGSHFTPLPPGHDIMAHMVTVVTADLKKLVGKSAPDELLIVHSGRLFKIGSDYAVGEYPAYAAVGSGKAWALGNLFGSTGEPTERILRALGAAQANCGSVRAPFYVKVAGATHKGRLA